MSPKNPKLVAAAIAAKQAADAAEAAADQAQAAADVEEAEVPVAPPAPPAPPVVEAPLTGVDKMRADRWAALQAEVARLAGGS